MKYNICSLILLSCNLGFAQYNFKENYFEDNKTLSKSTNYVEFSANYFVNSTAINQSMSNAIIGSSTISKAMQDQNLTRLQSNNSIGLGIGGTLKYKQTYKKFNLSMSVGTHVISNNTFSKDFYTLVMYGNQPFAGTRMNLKNTSVFVQAYNKLTLGAEKKIGNDFFVGVSGNVYQNLLYQKAQISKGDFLTQSSGEQIDLDIKYQQYSSIPQKRALGLGLDFFVMKKIKNGNVYLQVEDLGMMVKQELTVYRADSNYAFKGLEVTNIFDFDDGQYKDKKAHEIFGVEKKQKVQNQWLPTRFTLGFNQKLGKKVLLEYAMNYRLLPAYIPQIILRPNYFLTPNFSLAPVFNLGGYGKAAIGINLSYHHPRFIINTDILELENILAPNKTSGKGMFLRAGFLL